MPIPMPPNTTCDIYRFNRAPPNPPDVAGVKCYLEPRGQSTLTTGAYTHRLFVAATVDIRDDMGAGQFVVGPNADRVYVPDKTGTQFFVLLVRRYARGTALDHFEVLLQRDKPTWPSANV